MVEASTQKDEFVEGKLFVLKWDIKRHCNNIYINIAYNILNSIHTII
jgi:hypothetical protein